VHFKGCCAVGWFYGDLSLPRAPRSCQNV